MTDYWLPLGLVDPNGVTESNASALTSAIYKLRDTLLIELRRYLIIDATSVTIRHEYRTGRA